MFSTNPGTMYGRDHIDDVMQSVVDPLPRDPSIGCYAGRHSEQKDTGCPFHRSATAPPPPVAAAAVDISQPLSYFLRSDLADSTA